MPDGTIWCTIDNFVSGILTYILIHMNENFESNIPLPAIIAGFVVLLVASTALNRWLRQRHLIKEGQINTKDGRVPSIDERIAGNKDWATGEILSKGRGFITGLCVTAFILNFFLGTAFIKVLTNPSIPTAPTVVLGVFLAFAIALAVFAVRAAMQFYRFGQSRCRITGKAGVLGTEMKGVVLTANEVCAIGDYTFDIQCLESYSTGSGKNRRTETKVHWQTKRQVPHSGKSSKVGIPFSIDLPTFPPETGDQLSRGNVTWQLRIHAPVKGVDYSATFFVPVFDMNYKD